MKVWLLKRKWNGAKYWQPGTLCSLGDRVEVWPEHSKDTTLPLLTNCTASMRDLLIARGYACLARDKK